MIHHYCPVTDEETMAYPRDEDYRLACQSCGAPVETSNGVRYEAPQLDTHVCGLCGIEFYSSSQVSRNIHEREVHSWDRYLDDQPPATALRAIDAQHDNQQITLNGTTARVTVTRGHDHNHGQTHD